MEIYLSFFYCKWELTFTFMLQLARALKELEKEDSLGNRIATNLVVVTADREFWNRYKKLNSQLSGLKPGTPEHDELTLQIKETALRMGGKFLRFDNCIHTGRQGKGPTKAEINRAERKDDLISDPRHYKNKTRNIELLTSRENRKFHIKLLLEKDAVKIIH